MFTNSWRRGRFAALIGVCTAGILAAAGVSATAAVAQPKAPAHAQVKVPWAQVGPGWELVTSAAYPVAHGTTLYLVGPNGAKYTLRTWPGSTAPGTLIAWSGDKARALFFNDDSGRVTQLNVMTGKTNSFTLTGETDPQGYTLPHGLNILTVQLGSEYFTMARYNLTGKLQKVLLRDKNAYAAVYNPNGETLAVPDSNGVRLVNNATGAAKYLKVQSISNCEAARWWNNSTILAACYNSKSAAFVARLWLVPANGARPTALTPQRKAGHDLGDIGAWRLSSGLYLQSSLGACATVGINKQAANGSITPVKVPGTVNTNNVIVTADGPRLLIDPSDGCLGGSGLLWFNPGTHAEQWLFRFAAHTVLDVKPFNSIENA
jgi:hypothetical protein